MVQLPFVEFLFAVAIGILAGFGCGILGIGGGSIMVPLIFHSFGVPIKEAIGTSSFIIVFSSIVALAVHWREKRVHPGLAFSLAVPGVLGAQVGARLTSVLPELSVKVVFAAVISALGVRMMLSEEAQDRDTPLFCGRRLCAAALIGLTGGVVSGMCGVGGAVCMVPLLHILLRVPIHVCVATGLVPVLFNAASASSVYFAKGLVNLRLGLMVGIGSIAASPLGARVSGRTHRDRLRRLFAVVLILSGISVLFRK